MRGVKANLSASEARSRRASQHLCSGEWRDGTAKACTACQSRRKPKTVKREGES